MTHSVRQSTETTVFIAGSGRSGSTLLESLLAELDDVVVLGEVVHLAERGVEQDQRCACGEHFSDCPFWNEVGGRAFGSWQAANSQRFRYLKRTVARHRNLPQVCRKQPSPEMSALISEYSGYFRRIYAAAREVTGASVVVDSSKELPTVFALSHNSGIDVRVMQVVRDSRAVAYSWSKFVPRPETATQAPMPRLSPTHSTLLWLAGVSATPAVRRLGTATTTLRYEDLVEETERTILDAWQSLALRGTPALSIVDRTIELRPTHSVAGNPSRFEVGPRALRLDTEWIVNMTTRNRWLVTAMSYPALRALGYKGRQ